MKMIECDWHEIFQVEQVEKPYSLKAETVGDCNQNCLDAKELKCVCKCGGRNHGVHLRVCIKPLDSFPLDLENVPRAAYRGNIEA
jgi:hypothetical protein